MGHLSSRSTVNDSDEILVTLQSKLSAPLSEAAVFGYYIQATLGAMSKLSRSQEGHEFRAGPISRQLHWVIIG